MCSLKPWSLSKANRVMVPAGLSIRVRLTTEPVWYWMRSARFVGFAVRVLFGFIFWSLVDRLVGGVDNIDFCAPVRVVFWLVPCPSV